ncbi:MAG: hypothetical protein JXA30_13545 [Deltaproteobacteria bacterium]|nr:hypothetical protein [Deltaproteobacteria bacterium]
MNRGNSREQWRERVRRWKDGGLTARQFAREMGLNHHTLLWWSSHLKREQVEGRMAAEQQITPEFIELTEAFYGQKPAAVEAMIEVLVLDVLIKVPRNFDEQTLRRVLAAIRQP